MDKTLIRCVRCKGRKNMFKVNNGYSAVNTGGVEVKCPMCLGTGTTKTPQEIINEIAENSEKCTENVNQSDINAEKLKEKRKSGRDDEKSE